MLLTESCCCPGGRLIVGVGRGQQQCGASVKLLVAGRGCNGLQPSGSGVTNVLSTKSATSSGSRLVTLRAGLMCRRCDRVMTTRPSLIRHQWRAHRTPVKCRLCSTRCTSQLDLRGHYQRLHEGVADGLMKCRLCQRLFTDITYLQRHHKLHQATVRPLMRVSA